MERVRKENHPSDVKNVRSTLMWLFTAFVVFIMSACGSTQGSNVNAVRDPQASTNSGFSGNDSNSDSSASDSGAGSQGKASIDYPQRPLRLIYTHGASGSPVGDGGVRLFLTYLEKVFEAPIVFENTPGAGGNIAREMVWKAEPDGYTLLVSNFPSMDIGKIIPGGDFEPLEYEHVYSIIGSNLDALAVPADSPFQTLADFAATAKANPGSISIAGLGVGTISHLETLQIEEALDTTFRFIPFDSAAATVAALAGKQTDAAIADIANYLAFGDPSKIRMLGALGTERDARVPDLPTLKEQGVAADGLVNTMAFFAPPGTPQAIIDHLIDAFDKAAKGSDYSQKLYELGAQTHFLAGEELYRAHKEMYDAVMRYEHVLLEARSQK